jgi:drug/metabolite transporter (DMT)-like permease
MDGSSVQRATLLAFLAIVAIGGMNGIGVRFSNLELDPFWGAAVRFGLASVLLVAVVALRRLPVPRGRALVGSLLYGLVGFAAAYGFAYYGLVETPASVGMVMLALVPLLTLLLAVAHGLERLRLQGLVGSLLALVGVGLIFSERLLAEGADAVPLLSLLAVLGSAVAIAETGVIVKRFPRVHPVVNNAIAMGVGALLLLGLALVAGDRLLLPSQPETLVAVGYLVALGSVALFMLFLYVIERWTASATSYSLLLMPLVAIVGGAVLLGEPVTVALIGGSALILAGVYVGAFAPTLAVPLPGLRRREAAAAAGADGAGSLADEEEGPPVLPRPGCP